MPRPRYSGKRRKGEPSLFDQPHHFKPVPEFKEIVGFFKEQREYLPALLLFQNRALVPKAEIEQVSRGAVTVLASKGIIGGEKGGKKFKLTNAAREALGAMKDQQA